MDKILLLLLGLLAVCVAFLVFAYNQKSKLEEKKVKENFEDEETESTAEGSTEGAGEAEGFDEGAGEVESPAKGADEVESPAEDTNEPEYFENGEDDEIPPAQVPVGPEHYSSYREHFEEEQKVTDEHFMSNNEEEKERFCGSASCFQEGFRSGNFRNSYRNPAGQDFFEGYGIESFVNGGNNFSHFNEHFEEEEPEQTEQEEVEPFQNYNYVREDFESQPLTLKLFYADWCGHCKRFKPTFDNELPELIRRKGIRCNLEAINADNQPDMVRKYNVKGFPTMILEKNGTLIEYDGDRTVSDIERFISQNL